MVMFPSINPVKKLQRDIAEEMDVRDTAGPAAAIGISELLKSFGASIDEDLPLPGARASRPDWSPLIDRIRAGAHHLREVEARARARDAQIDDLMRRVQEDLAEADARVRAAEAQVTEAEAQAVEMIRAAEAKAAAAEERARASEEWLARVHEVITAEFGGPFETDG
jgi:hypothetical protein